MLYALFQRPDAFRRYLSGSGDLFAAYPYLIQHTGQLAARQRGDPIQLFLTVGALEDFQFPFFDQLVEFLRAGNYPGLNVITEVFAGEGHSLEGIALTYLHGIRKVYREDATERRP